MNQLVVNLFDVVFSITPAAWLAIICFILILLGAIIFICSVIHEHILKKDGRDDSDAGSCGQDLPEGCPSKLNRTTDELERIERFRKMNEPGSFTRQLADTYDPSA